MIERGGAEMNLRRLLRARSRVIALGGARDARELRVEFVHWQGSAIMRKC